MIRALCSLGSFSFQPLSWPLDHSPVGIHYLISTLCISEVLYIVKSKPFAKELLNLIDVPWAFLGTLFDDWAFLILILRWGMHWRWLLKPVFAGSFQFMGLYYLSILLCKGHSSFVLYVSKENFARKSKGWFSRSVENCGGHP